MNKSIDTIIWDWNGTLLDDVDICVDCINTLLGKRQLTTLNKFKYQNIFRFPVEDYYQDAGFDFSIEPFDVLAHEFIDLYLKKLPEALLFPKARETLKKMRKLGFNHYLVSAMEHDTLINSLMARSLLEYFHGVKGIQDHYAKGKVSSAKALIDEYRLDIGSTCLVGDTDHDYEVARELGCSCVLISNGHQLRERLLRLNGRVIQQIEDLPWHLLYRLPDPTEKQRL